MIQGLEARGGQLVMEEEGRGEREGEEEREREREGEGEREREKDEVIRGLREKVGRLERLQKVEV